MPADFGCGTGEGLAGCSTEAASELELESEIEGSFEAVAIFIQITRNRDVLHLRGNENVDKACSQLSIGPGPINPECATWFDEGTCGGFGTAPHSPPPRSHDLLVMTL